MADLVRAIRPLPEGMQLDFLRASSYVGASTTSEEAVSLGLVSKIAVAGRHVLVVEDIVDTGATLQVSKCAAALHAAASASLRARHHAPGIGEGVLTACWAPRQEVCTRLRAQGAASVLTVALLDKSARRTVALQPDYKGFEVRTFSCMYACCLCPAQPAQMAIDLTFVRPSTCCIRELDVSRMLGWLCSAQTSLWWASAWTTTRCTGPCRTLACFDLGATCRCMTSLCS